MFFKAPSRPLRLPHTAPLSSSDSHSQATLLIHFAHLPSFSVKPSHLRLPLLLDQLARLPTFLAIYSIQLGLHPTFPLQWSARAARLYRLIPGSNANDPA